MTLKEIAIELLEKYEASESMAICEYSGNIDKDLNLLDEEVKKFRKMIDDAEQTEPQTCENCYYYSDVGVKCCDREHEPTTPTTKACEFYEPKDEPQQVTSKLTNVGNSMVSAVASTMDQLKSKLKDEPQTEYKKWETKPKADIPKEVTICVSVPAWALEDESQTERSE